jgi:hypothetical protein
VSASEVLERPVVEGVGVGRPESARALPAWPVYLLIGGFPAWWALGASAFAAIICGGIMLALMVQRGRIRTVPGILPWFGFVVWALAAGVTLNGLLQSVGYAQRVSELAAVGILILYYVNARERLNVRKIVGSLVVLWVSVVILGVIAIQFPNMRLTTPVGLLLPESLTSNRLVYHLVFPRLAEVQQPWGAERPFNRPAAPFPFANSWGAAYAILTPVVFAFLASRPRRWIRIAVWVLLVVSLWPAVESSNRGMFVAVAIAAVYVIGRLALRGRLIPALTAALGLLGAGVALVWSGAADQILGRQQYSNSTGTRIDVYLATIGKTLESPFLGWATPQEGVTAGGVALGTQGQIWTVMYSYGFVGLFLFCLFLFGAVFRTWTAPKMGQLWLHSVLVMTTATMWFYGLGTIQLAAVALLAAALLRAKYRAETLW